MTPATGATGFGRTLSALALAALLLVPFATSALEASPWATVLAWGAMTLAAAAWLFAIAAGDVQAAIPLTRLEGACVTVLLVLAAASALLNPAAASGLRRAAPFGLVLLLLPSARWLVSRRGAGAARLLLGAVVASGSLAAAAAVLQASHWLRLDDQGRATALFANPNHLSGLLDMALPLAAAGAFFGRRNRALLGAAAALMLVGQGFTFSRAGWLVDVAAVVALAVVWAASARGAARRCRWAGLVAAILAIAVLALALVALSPRTRGDLGARLADIASLQNDPSAELRPLLAGKALRVIERHPIVGVGYGAFGDAAVRYRGSVTQSASERDLRASIDHAHNDVLTLAAELGLLAALAMTALVASLVVRAARGAPSAALRWGAAAGLLALAAHGMVDGLLSRAAPLLPVWLLLAAAASTGAAGSADDVAAESVTPAGSRSGYGARGRRPAAKEG